MGYGYVIVYDTPSRALVIIVSAFTDAGSLGGVLLGCLFTVARNEFADVHFRVYAGGRGEIFWDFLCFVALWRHKASRCRYFSRTRPRPATELTPQFGLLPLHVHNVPTGRLLAPNANF